MSAKLEMIITLSESGVLKVTGPLHDLLTCYALLEGARDEVKRNFYEAKQPKVQPATADDMRHIAGAIGGS